LEVVVGSRFRIGCWWIVWKWLLVAGFVVVVVGWFGSGC
jgi:hypothetical protein